MTIFVVDSLYKEAKINILISTLKTVLRILCVFIFLYLGMINAFSQVVNPRSSTVKVQDSIDNKSDTIRNAYKSTTGQDTVMMKNDSGLATQVLILANDSAFREIKNNIVHLYGGAKVKYEGFELSADYIRLDRNTDVLFASGVIDDKGKYIGRPVVLFPNDTPKAVDSLRYNYKTQEGKTFGVMTETDGAFIQAKVLRKNLYDELSIYHGLYSTCDLPEPHTHFGIHISKGLVTDKRIIAGPSYLVVQGIPIKFLALPFAFFPKTDKGTSGFLFPSFGDDMTRGFGLRDFGWYLNLNDYWDSEIRGSFYSGGSWEANMRTNYMVNYKYNGGFSIRYVATKVGVEGSTNYGSNKDFNVTWNHTQRQEANPGTSFSASVNFGSSSFYQNSPALSNSYENQIRNSMNSSISYGRVFADGKVNFTSSATHSQDLATGSITLQLPTFSLNVATFNPFDSKDRVGEQKWYQRITVGYSLQGTNKLSTGDSTFFTKQTLNDFQTGFQHNIPISLSLNAFKHFQFNTSVNYTERWYLKTIRKGLENELNGYKDVTDTVPGFRRAYDYSFSSGLSTKIYGMYPKIGKIEAIRHIVTPSINFNYRPDFGEARYGYYKDYINDKGALTQYSIFNESPYGGPSSGRSMGIGFSIDNNIEAKVRSEKDTTGKGVKKIPILQGLTFSGNYNFAADSLKLTPINVSGRTTLFNDKINLNFNGSFDPYQLDYKGERINKFTIQNGKLARLTNFGLAFDYSFNPDASKSRSGNIDSLRNNMPSMTPEQAQALARISQDPNAFVDFNIPWNLAGSFNFQYTNRYDQVERRTKGDYSAALMVHGDFNVTPKWKIQFNSGYEFKQKEIALTRFAIYRDLHCWDISMGWVPFGRQPGYNVTIRAKASILQDLKLTKSNSNYNY